MPYIKDSLREEIYNGKVPSNPGELNYCFTLLILDYLKNRGESYQTYNDIVGAIECAKLELYRRKTSSYEEKKIVENGDIYE